MFYSGRYLYKNVTFTAKTPGQYLICAYSMDSSNITGNPYCYTVTIGVSAPVILSSSLSPIGNVYVDPSEPVTFSLTFDKIVKRSTTPATIFLIDSVTNMVVAAVNSTNITNVFLRNNVMTFNFGVGVVEPFKTYYITIQEGLY